MIGPAMPVSPPTVVGAAVYGEYAYEVLSDGTIRRRLVAGEVTELGWESVELADLPPNLAHLKQKAVDQSRSGTPSMAI